MASAEDDRWHGREGLSEGFRRALLQADRGFCETAFRKATRRPSRRSSTPRAGSRPDHPDVRAAILNSQPMGILCAGAIGPRRARRWRGDPRRRHQSFRLGIARWRRLSSIPVACWSAMPECAVIETRHAVRLGLRPDKRPFAKSHGNIGRAARGRLPVGARCLAALGWTSTRSKSWRRRTPSVRSARPARGPMGRCGRWTPKVPP